MLTKLSNADFKPCPCKGVKPCVENGGKKVAATWVECLKCKRMVGALNPDEALLLWSAAMDALAAKA